MYERTYGYNYDRDRTVKEDAANIRHHIKTMVKAELLPADWTYSVRYRSYAGGSSIDVRAISPRPIYAADPKEYREWVRHAETGEYVIAHIDKLTAAARMVRDALEDLQNGHNHDGSETQVDHFDVKFYGQVELSTVEGVPQYVEVGDASGGDL